MDKREKRRKKEKKRQQKRDQHTARLLSERRKAYQKVLRLVGANEHLAKLPKDFFPFIRRVSWPNLHIVIDKSSVEPVNAILQYLKCQFEAQIHEVGITIDGYPDLFTLADIHILYVLQQIFRSLHTESKGIEEQNSPKMRLYPDVRNRANPNIPKITEYTKKVIDCINAFIEKYERIFVDKLLTTIYQDVMKHFGYTNGIYPIIGRGRDAVGKIRLFIQIKVFDPKLVNIRTNYETRKAYRCYATSHPDGLVPVVWSPNVVGNEQPLEVYIQDHALHRIRERLTITPIGYVYDNIGRSMLNPVIVGKSGPSYMVEYRYFSNKLGYLIVSVDDGIALIRSFKFITMTGTPEFYALKHRLKGSREDFEYLGLDTLDILLHSDIPHDPQLRQIFVECGLGHLFDIGDPEVPPKRIADEIRRYFQLHP